MTTKTGPQQTHAPRLVALSKIKRADWNPVGRVEGRRLKRLMESIEDVGLLYPLLIDEKQNLIDGHRRLTIAEILEWEVIPCIVVSSEFEHTYGSLQSATERLTGNDILGIWLSNPNALLLRQRTKPLHIQEVAGRATVKYLYEMGCGYGVFDVALRIWRYIEGKVDVAKVVRWCVKHGMAPLCRHAMDNGVSCTKIVNAIEADAPLKIKLAVD